MRWRILTNKFWPPKQKIGGAAAAGSL